MKDFLKKIQRILPALTGTGLMVLFAAGCATIEGSIDVDSMFPDVSYISPAVADGVMDELLLPVDVTPDPDIVVRGYRFTVADSNGNAVYILEDSIPTPKNLAGKKEKSKSVDLPSQLSWNGKNTAGVFVPDGDYSYFIEAWDGMGNEGRTPDFLVVVDNTPPSSAVSSPYLLFSPNGDGRRDIILFNYENPSREELWTGQLLDVNGREINKWEWTGIPEPQEWNGLSSSGDTAADGVYSYILSSTDLAGNVFSKTLEGIVIDTRPSPITLAVSQRYFSPNGDKIKDTVDFQPFLEIRDNVVSWSVDIIDENLEVRRSVKQDGLPPSVLTFDGKGEDGTILPDGDYKAVLNILYKNGNNPEAESDPFTIDTEAPRINTLTSDYTLFSPDGDGNRDFVMLRQTTSFEELWEGKIVDAKNVTMISWEWQGDSAEIKWYGSNMKGELLPNGQYTYILESEDTAGNRTEKKLPPVTLDVRSTPVSLTMDNLHFSPNGDGKKDTLSIASVLEVKEGIKSWKLEILDSGEAVVRSYTGEGEPPAVVSFDGKTEKGEPAPEGSYQGRMTVSYLKGNVSTGLSSSFTIDTVPPQVAVNTDRLLFSPNGDGRKDVIQVNQDGSVEELWEGVIRNSAGAVLWKQAWKGKPLSFTWDGKNTEGSVVPDGEYTYAVSSVDRADNGASAQVGGIVVDNRPVHVSIETKEKSFSPNGDGVKDSITYTLKAALPSAAAAWHITIIDSQEQPWKTFTGKGEPPSTFTWNGESSDGQVADGDYLAELTVEYEKGDVARGRTAGTSFIDITPPSIVAVLSPQPFSPDGDGIDDVLSMEVILRDKSLVTGWQAEITDPYRKPFRKFSGSKPEGGKFTWNGKSEQGELVQSAEDYPVIITAQDELGNKARAERIIPVDILVIRDGDKLKIIISSIIFKPDTADYQDVEAITKERVDRNISTLNRLAEKLQKYPDYNINLEGHAVRLFWKDPARGAKEEKEELLPLSLQRAEAIKKALGERGIAISRMTSFGLGGTQPLVPHSDMENRWKNRRVEFILVK